MGIGMSDQRSLFDSGETTQKFDCFGSSILLHQFFFEKEKADNYFEALHPQTTWKQEEIKMFGEVIPLPRLTSWYGDPGSEYIYSGVKNEPLEWLPILNEIRESIQHHTQRPYNSLLMNLYRDGNDGVAWHADDEEELGHNPFIASLSLGATRTFQIKPKNGQGKTVSINLGHGDLLLMSGDTQTKCLHQIPKTKKVVKPRINLTFRNVTEVSLK